MTPPDIQRVNQRRSSRFTLVRQKHLLPILLGALCASIVLHLLGFSLLNILGAGLALSPTTKENLKDEDRPVVLTQDDDDDPPPPDINPPEEETVEVQPLDNLPLPDFEDLPIEELTIAPGETEINLNDGTDAAMEKLSPIHSEINMEKIRQGFDEPAFSEITPVTDNPVSIKSLNQPDEADADKWYKDQLKGAGGEDDSNLPDGSKTLSQLLSLPSNSLGKGSGYSRLGADLLFEYDRAILKNSAKIGLLKLAALIYKNPETTFIIEGHTDSFGSKRYNTLLSLMRANAVREWLRGNGVSLDKVYIRACGDSSPVVPLEGDKDKQAANRRVEIHMRKKGEAVPKDALPSSYNVDMTTPIARQLEKDVNLPANPAAPSGNEDIPVATPVDEEIPVAEPL